MQMSLGAFKESGFEFHDGLSVGESALGGTGLFLNSPGKADEDLIVLRVPSRKAWDYVTLLGVLEELKKREKQEFGESATEEKEEVGIKKDDKDGNEENAGENKENKDKESRSSTPNILRESDVIMGTLKVCEPRTETQILTCYFAAFVILQNLYRQAQGRDLEYYQGSPLRELDTYVDVLRSTWVCEFPESTSSADLFILLLVELAHEHKDKYHEFLPLLTTECKLDISQYLTFDEYYQIVQAVQSRTLEIPHSLETSDDDFYVNVTLVPILDFANHDFANNSYFDVEKHTGDILLKVKADFIPQASKFELTISYSPDPNIQYFVHNYGFVPQNGKYFVERFDFSSVVPNYDYTRQMMGYMPEAEIVHHDGKVYINLDENNLEAFFGEISTDADLLLEVTKGSEKPDQSTGDQEDAGDIGPDLDDNLLFNDSLKAVVISKVVEIINHENMESITVTNGFDMIANEYLATRRHLLKTLASSFDPLRPLALLYNTDWLQLA